MRRLAWLSVAISMFLSRVVVAADHEVLIALEPTYGLLSSAESRHGVGGTASAWVGVSDVLWFGASAGGFTFAEARPAPAVRVWETSVGLVLALDVFRWIPFVEGHLGLVVHGNELIPTVRFGLGVDYLLTPEWFLGAVVRTRPLADPLGDVLTTVSARVGLRFDL